MLNPMTQVNMVDQQSLPSPSFDGIKRFEDVFQHDIDTAIDVGKPDQSVIKVNNFSENNSFDLPKAIIGKIQKMDTSYHHFLSETPKDFEFSRESFNLKNGMRTYPDIQNSSKDFSNHIKESVESLKESLQFSVNNHKKLYKWDVKMKMWFGNFYIVSNAVDKVSEGFKTLFRAAG